MPSNFLKCNSCGKDVHFEQIKRCPICNRSVCKWCRCDDSACDDCFFSALQAEVEREQFCEEMTKLGFDRYKEVKKKP